MQVQTQRSAVDDFGTDVAAVEIDPCVETGFAAYVEFDDFGTILVAFPDAGRGQPFGGRRECIVVFGEFAVFGVESLHGIERRADAAIACLIAVAGIFADDLARQRVLHVFLGSLAVDIGGSDIVGRKDQFPVAVQFGRRGHITHQQYAIGEFLTLFGRGVDAGNPAAAFISGGQLVPLGEKLGILQFEQSAAVCRGDTNCIFAGRFGALPFFDVERVAHQFLAVTGSLEVFVAPVKVGEFAVPKIGCGIEQQAGFQRCDDRFVGPSVRGVEFVSRRHLGTSGGFVQQPADVIDAIIEMRTSGEAAYRSVGADVFVDNRARTEIEKDFEIIESLDEGGMRPVERLVVFGQE